jgi:hypothetical protein
MDCILDWLERLKPLWNFLTALGTLLAVCVSLFLASRKPKAHLDITPQLSNNNVVISIVNDGDADQTLSHCYWRTPSNPNRAFPFMIYTMNGIAMMNVKRMQNSDVVQTWTPLDAAATAINLFISDTATSKEIEHCILKSKFGCATTVGKFYEKNLPKDLQKALLDRLILQRTPI